MPLDIRGRRQAENRSGVGARLRPEGAAQGRVQGGGGTAPTGAMRPGNASRTAFGDDPDHSAKRFRRTRGGANDAPGRPPARRRKSSPENHASPHRRPSPDPYAMLWQATRRTSTGPLKRPTWAREVKLSAPVVARATASLTLTAEAFEFAAPRHARQRRHVGKHRPAPKWEKARTVLPLSARLVPTEASATVLEGEQRHNLGGRGAADGSESARRPIDTCSRRKFATKLRMVCASADWPPSHCSIGHVPKPTRSPPIDSNLACSPPERRRLRRVAAEAFGEAAAGVVDKELPGVRLEARYAPHRARLPSAWGRRRHTRHGAGLGPIRGAHGALLADALCQGARHADPRGFLVAEVPKAVDGAVAAVLADGRPTPKPRERVHNS